MAINDKKYMVPIEMDKEYAAKIGITPSEIKTIFMQGKPTQVYFVEIENEELYHELMRPIWQAEKEYERSHRCLVSNGNGRLIRCDGNCGECSRKKSGGALSIEAMEETGGFSSMRDGVHIQQETATYTESTADIVEGKITSEMLWKRISEMSEENRTILTMFANGASEREIAEAVGLSQKGVNKRKKALFAELKNFFEDFS